MPTSAICRPSISNDMADVGIGRYELPRKECTPYEKPIRHEPGEVLDQIDWVEAVKCAEALGKRSFMLEVMPVAVLEQVIDRSQPEKIEKKAWWKFW